MINFLMDLLGYEKHYEAPRNNLTLTIQEYTVLDTCNSLFKVHIPELKIGFQLVYGIGFIQVIDKAIDLSDEMRNNIRDVLRRYSGVYTAQMALMHKGQVIPSSLTLPMDFELQTPLDFSRAYSKYNKKRVTS